MTVFHLIDNLKRGGAETLLLEVVRNLPEHDNYIITVTAGNDFTAEECRGIHITSLNYDSVFSFYTVIKKLRKLIKEHQPSLVHAHLPFASLLARMATPKQVKLFISVHNRYSDSLAKKSRKLFFLEKKMHSARETLIFVSQAIKDDYNKIIGIKGKTEVLHNFIADRFFKNDKSVERMPESNTIKLVAVGSLKQQKNFSSLLQACALVRRKNFTLSIYGDGPEKYNLENLINRLQLQKVYLKGSHNAIEKVLTGYDAFILPSVYEGFGLAPLEAAATGLPLLLSDIDVFREVTKGNAVYFDPMNINSIAGAITKMIDDPVPHKKKALDFIAVVANEYSRRNYMQKLLNIYNS